MTEMSTELKEHIDMAFRTAVKRKCWLKTDMLSGVVLENDEVIKARRWSCWHRDETPVLPGPSKVLKQHGLELYNQVDIGCGRDQQYRNGRDRQQSV